MQDAPPFESIMKGTLMCSVSRFVLLGCAILTMAGLAACSKKSTPAQEAPQVNLSESDLFRQPVPAPTEALNPTSVVVTVNGQGITAQELERQLGALISNVRNRLPPEQLAQLGPRFREQAINQLVAKQLLKEQVAKANITATEEELAEARAKIEANMPPGLTIAELLKQRNLSEEQFQKEFSEEFRINKLIEQQTSGSTNITAEEVRAFYDQNPDQFKQPETATARHILIGIEPADSDEVKAEKKAKAEKVREQLLAGGDFVALAASESDDPGSKDNGGVYTFPRGQMVPAFEEAAFSQPLGEIGPLVETRFGYHIIKVDERKEARAISFEEVQTNLTQFLVSRQVQKAAQEYVEGLRSNAQVQVLIDQP